MDLWDWEMDEFFNRGNAFDLLTDETLCTNCQFSFGSRPWKETSPDSQRVDDIFPRRSQVLGNEKWFSSNLQVDDVHFKRLSDTKAFNQFVAAPTICCCAFLRTVKIDASRGIFNFFLSFACEQHHLICRTLNKVYCFLWKLLALTDYNRVHWFYTRDDMGLLFVLNIHWIPSEVLCADYFSQRGGNLPTSLSTGELNEHLKLRLSHHGTRKKPQHLYVLIFNRSFYSSLKISQHCCLKIKGNAVYRRQKTKKIYDFKNVLKWDKKWGNSCVDEIRGHLETIETSNQSRRWSAFVSEPFDQNNIFNPRLYQRK